MKAQHIVVAVVLCGSLAGCADQTVDAEPVDFAAFGMDTQVYTERVRTGSNGTEPALSWNDTPTEHRPNLVEASLQRAAANARGGHSSAITTGWDFVQRQWDALTDAWMSQHPQQTPQHENQMFIQFEGHLYRVGFAKYHDVQ